MKTKLLLLAVAMLTTVIIVIYGHTLSFYDFLLTFLYHDTVEKVSAHALSTELALDTIILLDTRAHDEYTVSHLLNAIHVDPAQAGELKLDAKLDASIVVYCTAGIRSERVGEQLLQLGYTNVRNLDGGIISWKNLGLRVVNSKDEVTDSVHVYDSFWGIWLQNGINVYD